MKVGINYRFGGPVVPATESTSQRLEFQSPGRNPGLLLCGTARAEHAPCSGPHCGATVRHGRCTQPQTALPTAADVDAAASRLAGVALRTPLISSPVLDAAVGARVFLKAETLQRTGSFKFRGAYNKLSTIPQERRSGGVVAYSSGNHAQGVAAAAQLLGMPAVIVMPSDAPRPKRERTAALGAEVVLYDRDREDRAAIARDIAGKRGAVLVPPFDDPMVIAGQGTAGREIVEDLAALGLKPDVVVVGASGGGLIAGIALAVKARVPGAKFYSAEPEGFDDTARSFKSGKREVNARMSGTICDALMTNTPGDITFEINRKLVGEGVTASDDEVGRAVAFAFRELKLVVEPGGAIGLAALLAGKLDVKGKVVVGGAVRRQCRRRAVPPIDRRLIGAARHHENSAIRSSSLIAMSAASGPCAAGARTGLAGMDASAGPEGVSVGGRVLPNNSLSIAASVSESCARDACALATRADTGTLRGASSSRNSAGSSSRAVV